MKGLLFFSLFFYCIYCSSIPIATNSYVEDWTQNNINSQRNFSSLIQPSFSYQDVLLHHSSLSSVDSLSKKRYSNVTNFAFVTPWNALGYDMAKLFAKKLDYISPVWFQIRPTEWIDAKQRKRRDFIITGEQDVDMQWMKQLKQYHPQLKIIPRFHLDQWDQLSYVEFFQIIRSTPQSKQTYAQLLSKAIVKMCRKYQFDGIVLEYGYLKVGNAWEVFAHWMTTLSKKLKKYNLVFSLVIPAIHDWKVLEKSSTSLEQVSVTKDEMEMLAPLVDFVCVMTYDAMFFMESSKAISPLVWNVANIEYYQPVLKEKLLLGLQFYGRDYTHATDKEGAAAILGNRFVELLQQYKPEPILLDEKAEENYFETDDQKRVYYPSLYSIDKRVALAQHYGIGISIWEIGQGLHYFMELL